MDMIANRMPLRYNISSWDQLPQCMSNNSRDLHIHVAKIINDERLQGTVIRVEHKHFGVLFACIVDGSGPLLTDKYFSGVVSMSTQAILLELEKFGFYVTYDPQTHLDGEQLQYLMTINQLGFDKIRILNVHMYQNDGRVKDEPLVVAFKIKNNSNWLNNGYSPSESEYLSAIKQGTAINISAISKEKKFRWDWLTFVANIEDILKDNA